MTATAGLPRDGAMVTASQTAEQLDAEAAGAPTEESVESVATAEA